MDSVVPLIGLITYPRRGRGLPAPTWGSALMASPATGTLTNLRCPASTAVAGPGVTHA